MHVFYRYCDHAHPQRDVYGAENHSCDVRVIVVITAIPYHTATGVIVAIVATVATAATSKAIVAKVAMAAAVAERLPCAGRSAVDD